MPDPERSQRKPFFQKALDAVSNLGVGLKVKFVLLCIGVIPPLVMLVILRQADSETLQNFLALYVAAGVLLYYPTGKAMEELIVLRQTRRINSYVDEVKAGRRTPHFELPGERGDEHDFLRLQRNIFWMVQGLKSREAKLQDTLGKLKTAQRQVLESIDYASRIQRSFLPSDNDLKDALDDYFLFWLPRDGVGGDAYWVRHEGEYTYLAVFDCTGHGVPGAFLTLIVNSLFEQNLDRYCCGNPARLLAKMNMGLKTALSQHGKNNFSDDGLEGAVCCIDRVEGVLHFAGARCFLLLAGNDGVREVKGDRMGVGFVHVPIDQEFANHGIPLSEIGAAYLFTDGATDQIGGPKKLPYGRRRLRTLLAEHSQLPMEEQKRIVEKEYYSYKGRNAQRDDVTVMGFSTKGFLEG